MVKLKVSRSDGTVIEFEGTAEDLQKVILNLVPWNIVTYPQQNPWWLRGDGTVDFSGLKLEVKTPPFIEHAPGQHLTGCPLSCPQ